MSRLALWETDHASATGNIRDCVLCLSGDTELRKEAMMTSSAVLTSFSMKLRYVGCAENKRGRKTTLTCNTKKRIST